MILADAGRRMTSDAARVTITVVGLPLGGRCCCNPSGSRSLTQSDLNLLELDMKERKELVCSGEVRYADIEVRVRSALNRQK